MARFNEILTGRFNRLAQKLFSMKGPASLVALNDEVQAVLEFERIVDREIRYLGGFETFGVSAFQGGVASQFGAIRLRNPANSNVVAVVEKVACLIGTGGAADSPALDHSNSTGVDLGTLVNLIGSAEDSRTRQTPTCIVSSSTAASISIGLTIDQTTMTGANILGSFISTLNQEFLLMPNCALQVRSITAANGLTVIFRWRERPLETSELT